jgi:hypothetical protein
MNKLNERPAVLPVSGIGPSPGSTVIRVFNIFVAVALVVLAAECIARILVVAGHPRRGVSPEFDVKMLVARSPVKGSAKQLVFIGGSYTKWAIYPELLRARLKDKGIDVWPKNLGTRRSCVQEHIALLQEAVRQAGPKAVVFYDLRQDAFLEDFQLDDTLNYSAAFRSSYAGHQYLGSHNICDAAYSFAEQNLSLVRDRSYLRDELFNSIGSIVDFDSSYDHRTPLEDGVKLEVSEMGTSAGYVSLPRDEWMKKFSQCHDFLWSDKYDKRWSLTWFNQVKDFCMARQLPLVVVWLPECHPYPEGERERDLSVKYSQLADNKNVWYIDMHSTDHNMLHYRDPAHLNIAGSAQATEFLANRLAQEPFRSLVQSGERQKL